MRMTFRCRCFQKHTLELTPPARKTDPFTCHICGKERPLLTTESVVKNNVLDRCPMCKEAEFYYHRDFPPFAGVTIVSVGCVAAFTAGMLWGFWPLFATLAVLAIIDFVLFRTLPNVTKCYVCKTEFRGYAPNPAHGRYDLGHADAMDARHEALIESLK